MSEGYFTRLSGLNEQVETRIVPEKTEPWPAGMDAHDVGFVHRGDAAPVAAAGILEGKLSNAPARLLGDELDALHNAIHDLKERQSRRAARARRQLGTGSRQRVDRIVSGTQQGANYCGWHHTYARPVGSMKHQPHKAGIPWLRDGDGHLPESTWVGLRIQNSEGTAHPVP